MNAPAIKPMKPLPLSRHLPLEVGTIHFIGIGGIGMSGIAEILHNLGYRVQGSDIAEGYNTERLRALGITVKIGHTETNVKDASVVVISSAVKPSNPEVIAARGARIPVVKRAEMLAEIMRFKMSVAIAGTHGKTTTTSLMAALFETAGMNPTVINGGIINAYGTNARVGKGEWMVVEADESDGTFIKIPATVAIITNIDPEHLEHYGSFDGVRVAFLQFIENLPFYGFGVLCADHPEVQALLAKITDRRIITYGFSPQADVRAENLRVSGNGQLFDIAITLPGEGNTRSIKDVMLPMHGEHNVSNALSVVAVAQELHTDDDTLKKAFANFAGVKRRFTQTGEVRGVKIIDDYGHHPVEIAATLKAARAAASSPHPILSQRERISMDGEEIPQATSHEPRKSNKVIAVVQPHRYSRVRDLFKDFCTCFNDADTVIVADIYSAGEDPIPGISRDTLVEGIRASGHKHVMAIESPEALAPLISSLAKHGDYVVCMGAGNITQWAHALPKQLANV